MRAKLGAAHSATISLPRLPDGGHPADDNGAGDDGLDPSRAPLGGDDARQHRGIDDVGFSADTRAEFMAAYLALLGERCEKNGSFSLGGTHCGMVYMRRKVYQHIHRQAVERTAATNDDLLAAFLREERVCLDRTLELTMIHYYIHLKIRPESFTRARLFASSLSGCDEFSRGIKRRIRDFFGREHLLLRLYSWRLDLYLRRQEAVWQWMESAKPHLGELHVPLLFTQETSPRPGQDVRTRHQAHSAYIGISSICEPRGYVLYFRVDDEWNYPLTRVVRGDCEGHGGRLKISSLCFRLDRAAVFSHWAREKLAPVLECTQFGWTDFRDRVLALDDDETFHALGGGFVPPAQQNRPIAAQQGAFCSLKNHSRGVASRLEDFLARAHVSSPAERAREMWHVLKARERAAATVMFRAQDRAGRSGEDLLGDDGRDKDSDPAGRPRPAGR